MPYRQYQRTAQSTISPSKCRPLNSDIVSRRHPAAIPARYHQNLQQSPKDQPVNRGQKGFHKEQLIPIRKNADWYARGVGGAAAREIKALYQPATCLIESMNWRAGMI